ncbi:ferritin-like domain-containing protein [Acidiferrobacter sp.]|uniref:ferritin-like domain-containing protein n=1 Tax=Acidiferrobacter sp. TaxID=1872107 RepID=UPI0026164970|nr:ferritin-like domain-containing protein [Acidiferrobacter sp.]
MHRHPRVTGFLTRALNHEYSAVQQYVAQAAVCTLQGRADWAQSFRDEAREELAHAEALSGQLLMAGIAPCAGSLRAARPGRDLDEMLERDCDLEQAAVNLYAEAASVSMRLRDREAAELFAALKADEEEHLRHLRELRAALAPRL